MVAQALTLLTASSALLLSPLRPAPAPRVTAPRLSLEPLSTISQLIAERPLTDEAIKAAEGTLGWWGNYIYTVENGIFTLHDAFEGAGIPGAYGLSIFCFVLGVKLVTLPLNWKQLSSASAMKVLKPQQDLVRKWYGDNSDMLNMQVGELFEKNQVNPLAGCLPSLAQIPVFLGVYYSVTAIAKAKIYTEGFLWLPSLSGPIADRREGISWLTENWVNNAPKLGWEDTLAYLSIPLILVVTQVRNPSATHPPHPPRADSPPLACFVTQTVSLNLLGSFEQLEESDDQSSKTTAIVLRGLPFMLGWFAMNAPAGLGLYWVFNNILTTTTTVTIKKLTEKKAVEMDVRLPPIPTAGTHARVPALAHAHARTAGD